MAPAVGYHDYPCHYVICNLYRQLELTELILDPYPVIPADPQLLCVLWINPGDIAFPVLHHGRAVVNP